MTHPSDDIACAEAPFSYATLPRLRHFSDVLDDKHYVSAPADWLIGLCDVVQSTRAIAEGRYRAVNVAGAAAIAAARNALCPPHFAFVFSGDGASMLVAPADRDRIETALAATATWVRESLGLDLRTALIPVAAVHAAGYQLRVALYTASNNAEYAMFSGGGLSWADNATKRGLFAVPPAPSGALPDLTGLSCRFEAVTAGNGIILTIIVVPQADVDMQSTRAVLSEVLATTESSPSMGHPLPVEGPHMRAPWLGLGVEVRAKGRLAGSYTIRYAAVLAKLCLRYLVFRFGFKFGGISSKNYRRNIAQDADFRKYDDGLRLTVSCTADTADSIERLLMAARDSGLVNFGMHRQSSAIVTCVTSSMRHGLHIHFIDGADGGYAMAAQQLKGVLV